VKCLKLMLSLRLPASLEIKQPCKHLCLSCQISGYFWYWPCDVMYSNLCLLTVWLNIILRLCHLWQQLLHMVHCFDIVLPTLLVICIQSCCAPALSQFIVRCCARYLCEINLLELFKRWWLIALHMCRRDKSLQVFCCIDYFEDNVALSELN